VQPDTKILLGGYFSDTNGVQMYVLRLMSDGSLDPSFSPPVLSSDFGAPSVSSLAIQPDGRIVIGGGFSSAGGVSRHGLARLSSNGSLDLTFDAGAGLTDQFGSYNLVNLNSIVVQGDGKLILGGAFGQLAGAFHTNIARLNPDGSVDAAFNSSVNLESSSASVSALALQPDGRMLVAGTFALVNGVPRNGIARLLPDGSLDTQFHSSQDSLGLLSYPYLNQVSLVVNFRLWMACHATG
jgi:uncharacterized delta-60 repeat protein